VQRIASLFKSASLQALIQTIVARAETTFRLATSSNTFTAFVSRLLTVVRFPQFQAFFSSAFQEMLAFFRESTVAANFNLILARFGTFTRTLQFAFPVSLEALRIFLASRMPAISIGFTLAELPSSSLLRGTSFNFLYNFQANMVKTVARFASQPFSFFPQLQKSFTFSRFPTLQTITNNILEWWCYIRGGSTGTCAPQPPAIIVPSGVGGGGGFAFPTYLTQIQTIFQSFIPPWLLSIFGSISGTLATALPSAVLNQKQILILVVLGLAIMLLAERRNKEKKKKKGELEEIRQTVAGGLLEQ